jgi:hypothetical protein
LGKIESFFDVPSSKTKDTEIFKGKSHSDLVEMLVKWVERRNGSIKLFGQIIHGPREAGIDFVAKVCSDFIDKVGIQLKNNDDVKEKDFTSKLKAQVLDSKKHSLRSLIVVFAADMTDGSVEGKVRGMLSELSQLNDASIKSVPPEKTATMIKEVISRAGIG